MCPDFCKPSPRPFIPSGACGGPSCCRRSCGYAVVIDGGSSISGGYSTEPAADSP